MIGSGTRFRFCPRALLGTVLVCALGLARIVASSEAKAEPLPVVAASLGEICSRVETPFDSSLREFLARVPARGPRPSPLHQRVATENPKAQGWYDEGVLHLAAYDWLFAARAFRRALAADERLTMAHVGLARAFLEMEAFAEAADHLAAATRLATGQGASPIADGWRKIFQRKLEALCVPVSQRASAQRLYIQQIDALLELTGGDSHVLTLRGVASEATVAGRGQGGGAESVGWFRQAIEANPNQLDAHHFLIHAYETLGQHQRALPHAQVFAKGAAHAPHALHMVGHVLARSKKWEEAAPWFRRADLLHRARLAEPASASLMRRLDWHFGHNLRILAEVEWQLGRREVTYRLLEETADTAFHGWRGTFYETPSLELLLLRGQYTEALAGAARLATRGPLAQAFAFPLVAEALLGLGRTAEAEKAAAQSRAAWLQLEPLVARIPAGRPDRALAHGFQDHLNQLFVLRQPSAELRAKVLHEARQRTDALVSFDAWIVSLSRYHRLNAVTMPPASHP